MRMSQNIASAVGWLVALVFLLPAMASAQSGLAGVVKDTTGAVLPGVSVEATSPVLIEKVRSVVTDGEGQYKIVDLRPGTYAVTFTLPGFSAMRRDGIELPAAFTATVNAELRVGTVEETLTVSGTAPTVDVQNVLQQKVFEKQVLDSLPATRSPQAFVVFTPGITSVRLGGIAGGRDEYSLAIHGGRATESLITIDGDKVVFTAGTGGTTQAVRYNQATIQEISVQTGATSAEQQTSGIVSNIIPKEGSNAFTGYLTASYSGDALQGSNLSDALLATGLTSVSGLISLWEVTPAVGGRIVRDKLWFYSAFRAQSTNQSRAGLYQDLDPTDWVYTPDLTRQLENKIDNPDMNTRLTWQATSKNKFSVFFQSQNYFQHHRNFQNLTANEATNITKNTPNTFGQIVWKSPMTNRLLLEGGFSTYHFNRNQRRQNGVDLTTVPAQELGGEYAGIFFRSAPFNSTDLTYGRWDNGSFDYRGSASFITGSHAFKTGVYFRNGWALYSNEVNGNMGVTLLNGAPRSLTLTSTPWDYWTDVNADLGLYAQDQWTLKRLTLNVGVRYDYFNGSARATHLPAVAWVGARDFEGVPDVPKWSDISPRFGAAFDLFGDGKTAIKVALGRYVATQGTAIATANHPLNKSVLSVTRNWTDADRDFVPDCDLTNPLLNGECAQISNLNFGRNNPNATTYADDVVHGFGVRAFNWNAAVELQRDLGGGVSMAAGYYRRWYGNFTVTDNREVTPADYDAYCVTAPADSRLPGGGGYPVCGLYDVSQAKFGRVLSNVTMSDVFGKQTEVYDGFDLTAKARFQNGAQLSGGMNVGRTVTDRCFVVDSPQELQYCRVAPPFQPNFKFFGVYPLPWWGLLTSAVFQAIPGPEITATRLYTSAEVLPSLNRNLASGAAGTVNVSLVEPGTMFAKSSRQVDIRLSKSVRFWKTGRIQGNLDIFNVFNSSGVQTLNVTYGPAWQRATLIQGARSLMIGGQLEF
jgi:hypothetical protein